MNVSFIIDVGMLVRKYGLCFGCLCIGDSCVVNGCVGDCVDGLVWCLSVSLWGLSQWFVGVVVVLAVVLHLRAVVSLLCCSVVLLPFRSCARGLGGSSDLSSAMIATNELAHNMSYMSSLSVFAGGLVVVGVVAFGCAASRAARSA